MVFMSGRAVYRRASPTSSYAYDVGLSAESQRGKDDLQSERRVAEAVRFLAGRQSIDDLPRLQIDDW